MKTRLLVAARRNYNSDLVSRELNRLNQLKWARAVKRMGSKWVLAQPITLQGAQK